MVTCVAVTHECFCAVVSRWNAFDFGWCTYSVASLSGHPLGVTTMIRMTDDGRLALKLIYTQHLES